jgi:hypothetical protein
MIAEGGRIEDAGFHSAHEALSIRTGRSEEVSILRTDCAPARCG